MYRNAVSLLLLFTLTSSVQAQEQRTGEWIQLFNGENLDGWTPKIRFHDAGVNHGDTFRVVDGLLTVAYDQYAEFNETFGHLFYNKPFSNYVIRVEYRFIGDQVPGGPNWAIRNSGIMIHGESPKEMTKDQRFPASIEVQLLGGTGRGERHTANLCTPGTHVEMNGKLFTTHCTNSTSATYHGDQWVTVEIEVRGNSVVRHKIDGETVLEYQRPQLDDADGHSKELIAKKNGDKMLSGGTISLQSESHPVQFRKVELKKLAD